MAESMKKLCRRQLSAESLASSATTAESWEPVNECQTLKPVASSQKNFLGELRTRDCELGTEAEV